MKFERASTDVRAASTVIGVVLLVAITIVIASIVGTAVFGISGDALADQPHASFALSYTEGDVDGEGYLEIVHHSGDQIPAGRLSVRGTGIADTGSSVDPTLDVTSSGVTWPTADATGPDSSVTAGNTIYVGVESDFDVAVVWIPGGSGASVVLAEADGPGA